ncbi:response regulator [Arsenophonus apicola]|uniref:response regulator n=1 Tax=Arsenophonus apicola TaxID=2879119 RepID=UPI003879C865
MKKFKLISLIFNLILPTTTLATEFNQIERDWLKHNPVIYYTIIPNNRIEYIHNNVHHGISREYLNEIEKKTGLKFIYRDQKEKNIKIIANFISKTSHDKKWLQSYPYIFTSAVIVTRPDAPSMFTPHQLDGKKVVVKRNSPYEAFLKEHYPQIILIPEEDAISSLNQLCDTCDAYAVIGPNLIFWPLVHKYYANHLNFSGVIPELNTNITMAISSDMPILKSIIDKSLNSISAKRSDEIYKKWIDELDITAPPFNMILKYYYLEIITAILIFLFLLTLLFYIRKAQISAQNNELSKSLFISMMSHEIRTPLNAIIASLEILKIKLKNKDLERFTTISINSSLALLSFLNNVLDASKLEAKELKLRNKAIDINQLLIEIKNEFTPLSESKKIALIYKSFIPEKTYINIDCDKLRQILRNIISNAIKFTEQGYILYTAKYKKNKLFLLIKDSGIGIDDKKQKKLFQPWFQVTNKELNYNQTGSGLGLFICKQFSKIMKADFSIKSIKNIGTEIKIAIPADKSNEIININKDEEINIKKISPLNRLSILIVDDNIYNIDVITKQLDILKCDWEYVLNGNDAIEKFKQENYYDLVLLDSFLPDMTGYEVCNTIRNLEKIQNRVTTPIISISANTSNQHIEQFINHGGNDILSKPITLKDLATCLTKWSYLNSNIEDLSENINTNNNDELFYKILTLDFKNLSLASTMNDTNNINYYLHRMKGAALQNNSHAIANLITSIENLIKKDSIDIKNNALIKVLLFQLEALTHKKNDFN